MWGQARRPHRCPKLTLRGLNVREVFRLVIEMTKAAGIPLHQIPMATPQGEDDLAELEAEESKEEAPLAPLQEEEENADADWASPLNSAGTPCT